MLRILDKKILHSLQIIKPKKISIIDGENFRFIPFKKKIEFLQYYSNESTLFVVEKSNTFYNFLNNNGFNQFYLFKIKKADDNIDKNKKYCFDDSFCIYLSNLLLLNNHKFDLFSNDNYNDFHIIKKQNEAIVETMKCNFIFNSIKELKSIKIDTITIHKKPFY